MGISNQKIQTGTIFREEDGLPSFLPNVMEVPSGSLEEIAPGEGELRFPTIEQLNTGLADLVNALSAKLDLAGGTMTGKITLDSDPTLALHAATKQYVENTIEDEINSALSGTAGYLPKFTGANSIGNSPIFVSGENVGIGTTKPSADLTISRTGGLANISISRVGGSNAELSSAIDLLEHAGGTESAFGTTDAFGFRLVLDGLNNNFLIQSGNQTQINTRIAINRDTGNVGIGTTNIPEKLTLDGNFAMYRSGYTTSPLGKISYPSSVSGFRFETLSSSDPITFWTNGQKSVEIKSTGGIFFPRFGQRTTHPTNYAPLYRDQDTGEIYEKI